nr:hypothetical protein [Escherichia coli]
MLAALDENGGPLTRDSNGVLERGSPDLRAKPRVLPSSGGCRLAAYPARPNLQLAVELSGRRPGRGTASAAGEQGPPSGRTARAAESSYYRWSCRRSARRSATAAICGAERHDVFRPAVGILWCVSTAAPVCSYGIKRQGDTPEGDPLEWRSGCRPVVPNGVRTDK